MLEQLFCRGTIGGKHHHADAGANEALSAIDLKRVGQQREDLLGHLGGLRRVLQTSQQHHELIPAESRHRIAFPHASAQAVGNHTQKLVAASMSQRVIDTLESVKVQEQQRQLVAVSACMRQLLLQTLAQKRPVRQPGEIVVVGAKHQLRLARVGGKSHPDPFAQIARMVDHFIADLLLVDHADSQSTVNFIAPENGNQKTTCCAIPSLYGNKTRNVLPLHIKPHTIKVTGAIELVPWLNRYLNRRRLRLRVPSDVGSARVLRKMIEHDHTDHGLRKDLQQTYLHPPNDLLNIEV